MRSASRAVIKSRNCRRSRRTSLNIDAIVASVRRCGKTTQAPLPDEVVGQFGPQLTALMAYLTVVCRLPRLVVQRLLEGALQIPISLGSTQAAWEEASAAVAAPYAELEAALPHEAVLNADETGHRTNGDKRWLWAFVARTFVFYRIATSRGIGRVEGVLGASFAGVLGSDRLPTYLTYIAGQRQFCWAHLTRNLLSALDLARRRRPRRSVARRSRSTADCFACGGGFAAIPRPVGRRSLAAH